jgi:hypothetical protein
VRLLASMQRRFTELAVAHRCWSKSNPWRLALNVHTGRRAGLHKSVALNVLAFDAAGLDKSVDLTVLACDATHRIGTSG